MKGGGQNGTQKSKESKEGKKGKESKKSKKSKTQKIIAFNLQYTTALGIDCTSVVVL